MAILGFEACCMCVLSPELSLGVHELIGIGCCGLSELGCATVDRPAPFSAKPGRQLRPAREKADPSLSAPRVLPPPVPPPAEEFAAEEGR